MTQAPLDEPNKLLIELLEYIEQVEKLKKKAAFTVPSEFFVALESDVRSYPEVLFNTVTEGDDVWLKIPRLKETAPPELPPQLGPWVVLSKSPNVSPTLNNKPDEPQPGTFALIEQVSPDAASTLFDQYVLSHWTPWANLESPRRKTIGLYNKLFALQQIVASEGAETPLEIVWGMGFANWKSSTTIKHPLLTQLCDLTLNTATYTLEIRPRETDPRLEIDCYAELEVPGVAQLDAFWKAELASADTRMTPFEATSFERILNAAVGHLDASGKYVSPAKREVPAPSENLCITDTWVIFARKRSEHIYLQDIERLKKHLTLNAAVPPVIQSFVSRGSADIQHVSPLKYRGLSSSDASSGVRELYFPMPYNSEQVDVVAKLEAGHGVVVQGPPGTGKTHTIANIICHYLAQGKRVLITAKGESALSVIQEKLPEEIRPLCVALLSDERDGMKQFEHAIQQIASQVSSIQPSKSIADIATHEAQLDQTHQQLAAIDSRIASIAEKHMRTYPFRGNSQSPVELATFVLDKEPEYNWLTDDLTQERHAEPEFTGMDVARLRDARLALKNSLSYVNCALPSLTSLPSGLALSHLHDNVVRSKQIEENVKSGSILPLLYNTPALLEAAAGLLHFLRDFEELDSLIKAKQLPWAAALKDAWTSGVNDIALTQLEALLGWITEKEAERKALLSKAVVLPFGTELLEDFNEALVRCIAGKSPFSLPFGKKDAREAISQVLCEGGKPASSADWSAVARLCQHRKEVRQLVARWNALAGEFSLPTITLEEHTLRHLSQLCEDIESVRTFALMFQKPLMLRITAVFGTSAVPVKVDHALRNTLVESLSLHLDNRSLAAAIEESLTLMTDLASNTGDISEKLRKFIEFELGNPARTTEYIRQEWETLLASLKAIIALGSHFDTTRQVTQLISKAGAPVWASKLLTIPVVSAIDDLTPSNWLEAWQWRCAKTFVETLDAHDELKTLHQKRLQAELLLSKTYQQLISAKTWLGVYNNSPAETRQALQQYLNAIQAVGAGTGVRAIRHRKTARDAMARAYKAVPCWVMPQWRVSESIPSEVGLFDLVVADEASQSDIWALPALLRGKKILIVGDHKQVSPSAVGLAEQKIKELQLRFLAKQPHGSEMTPDKSIYDLARVVFAGNSVMLKEHFRCVPAIIEFSNREFYQGDIKPLRTPKRSERLDPPLVDVYVTGGYRKGDTNPPEANAIVDEIESILEDPKLLRRSIGVVTLLGTEQAAFIHKLVHTRIPLSAIVERKITVGSPTVFQGGERDIMLLSLVAAPGDKATSSRIEFEQRFNVAASRARDRMILFRSIDASNSGSIDLKAKLINHFNQPFKQNIQEISSLRELCESGFETELFDILVKQGYRVVPQLKVGGYRIDFVIEGAEDRRLAVECDGDRFHGPGQWMDDITRQRILERAGWTFWRCFASSFVLRKQAMLEDLYRTLELNGIYPIGSENTDSNIWVEHRVINPLEDSLVA